MSEEPTKTEIKTYHIFPPINFARVGNSDSGFIIGPEKPGCGPTEFIDSGFNSEKHVTEFKDDEGKIKRQAARFRIFELTERYDETSNRNRVIKVEKEWQEIRTSEEVQIEWSVKLANRKGIGWSPGDGFRPDWFSRRNQLGEITENGYGPIKKKDLIIKQPEMSVCGSNDVCNDDHSLKGKFKGEPVSLGELKTDGNGHLLVLGGKGEAGFVNNEYGTIPMWRDDCFYNNEGWYDDTSDGTVSATVYIKGTPHTIKGEARVIVAPPDYAPSPGVIGIITQHDQLVQVAKDGYDQERWGWEGYDGLMASLNYPSFTNHIYPIIRAAKNLYWTIHTIYKNLSQFVSTDWLNLSDNTAKEAKLRATAVEQILALEHHLNFLKLTDVQKAMLEKYKTGDFSNDWEKLEDNAEAEHKLMLRKLETPIHPVTKLPPNGLIEAALTQAMGGGFHPGWEGGKDFVNIDHFTGPFRLKGKIGRFVENMAAPWQADLWGCRTWPNQAEDHEPWWPSHRPDSVLTPAIASGENRYFVNFAREKGNDQELVGRRELIHNFHSLGFVLPEIEEDNGLWKIDGELIERERELIEREREKLQNK